MEFVCYLALSMYFIEIIVSIMFHKKKVVYEWEPCLRENVHTQWISALKLKKVIVWSFASEKNLWECMFQKWECCDTKVPICLLLEYLTIYPFKLSKHGCLLQAVCLPFSQDWVFEIRGSAFEILSEDWNAVAVKLSYWFLSSRISIFS